CLNCCLTTGSRSLPPASGRAATARGLHPPEGGAPLRVLPSILLVELRNYPADGIIAYSNRRRRHGHQGNSEQRQHGAHHLHATPLVRQVIPPRLFVATHARPESAPARGNWMWSA